MDYNKILLIFYCCYLVIMSIIAFVTYGVDKRIAVYQSGDRIKEKTLLMQAVYGGAIGAFFGRLAFRHKTNKLYFSLVILLSLVLQIAVLALMIYCL